LLDDSISLLGFRELSEKNTVHHFPESNQTSEVNLLVMDSSSGQRSTFSLLLQIYDCTRALIGKK
jgi:hypothetical protein